MQKTIVKYVSGISDYATSFQMKMHRKYKVGLDMSAGLSTLISNMVLQEKKSLQFLIKIRKDSSFSDIRKSEGSEERIRELQIEKQ